ncbi:MAG TPA: hypothetical protein VN721_08625 [Flavipsychrobacter sp.]|nr:hypothetical protein [Flavipsychrobacter sp.]
MRSISNILLGVFFLFFAVTLWAQQKKTQTNKLVENPTEQKGKIRYKPIPVYLGHSTLSGGTVNKFVFDSLLKQGLTSMDSAGVIYTVSSFIFNYAERNLYEDSAGNLVMLTDYLLEYCPGDTLTSDISQTIYQRVKNGDTLYFDRVIVKRPDSTEASGKSMKFVITK